MKNNIIEVVKGTNATVIVSYSSDLDLTTFTSYLTVKISHNSDTRLIDLEADTFDKVNKIITFEVPNADNNLLVRDYVYDIVVEDSVNDIKLPVIDDIYRVSKSVRY